ncbi:MAG TPA: NUDIX hydrolase [Candidatus Nanoarchaeia archaeon]|nr:NUDIX hydrolase [Candidatus Nanoarchaeia archaeon]
MHQSAGAIIKDKDGKILMIERKFAPFGWAGPAGHINPGEDPKMAMMREVKEEVGLNVIKSKLIFHEMLDWNRCSGGVVGHDWYLYEVLEWSGELIKEESEVKNIKWVELVELKKIKLEEAYRYWFKKLSYL